MKDDKIYYRTTDLWLATFFRVRGLKLLSVERKDTTNKKVTFIFQESSERMRLTEEFFNNIGVGIMDVRNAMTETKSAIFNMPQINLKDGEKK